MTGETGWSAPHAHAAITIRRVTPNDIRSIARVHVAAWQIAYADVFPADYLARLTPADRVPRWRQSVVQPDAGEFTLAAFIDQELVGFANCHLLPSRPAASGEVDALYVDPLHWRRGIGSRLMLRLVAEFCRLSLNEAVLWVLTENAPARRFYEAHGWHLDDRVPPRTAHRAEVDVQELRYCLELACSET